MTTKDNGKNKKNKINDNTFGLFLRDFAIGFAGIIVFIIFGSTGLFLSKVSQVISQDNDKFTGNNFQINTTKFSSKNSNTTTTNKIREGPKPITMNTKHLLGMNGLAFWEIFFDETIKFEQYAKFVDKDLLNTNNNNNNNNNNIFKDIAYNSFEDSMKKGINGIKTIFNLMSGLNESVIIFLCGMFGLILLPIFFMYNFIWSFAFVIKSVSNSLVNEFSFFKGTSLDTSKQDMSTFKLILMALWLFLPRAFYIFTFFVFIIIILFVLPFYTTFQSIWKLLTANYKLYKGNNDNNENKCTSTVYTPSQNRKEIQNHLGTFIADVLYNKKILWLLVILNLFTCSNTWFGDVGSISSLAAVIIFIIYPGIFKTCVTKEDTDLFTKHEIKQDKGDLQSALFLINKYNEYFKGESKGNFEEIDRLCDSTQINTVFDYLEKNCN